MAEGTGGRRRVTSAQRAVAVSWLRGETHWDDWFVIAWVDACAVLVDEGYASAPRLLLRHLTAEPVAEAAYRALIGVPAANEVGLRRELRTPAAPPPVLPWWATSGTWTGPHGTGEAVYGRTVFDLRAVGGEDRPHIQVLVFGKHGEPAAVQVEVSDAGVPTLSSRQRPGNSLRRCRRRRTWWTRRDLDDGQVGRRTFRLSAGAVALLAGACPGQPVWRCAAVVAHGCRRCRQRCRHLSLAARAVLHMPRAVTRWR